MCVELNALFDSEMKAFTVTQVLKQGINITTMYPNYILEFRNTKSHLLQVYIGAWVKIDIAIESMSVQLLVIVLIVFKRYPSTYCLQEGSGF